MVHVFAKIRQNRKKIDFFNILDQITNWKTEDPVVSQIAYFNFAIYIKIKNKKKNAELKAAASKFGRF